VPALAVGVGSGSRDQSVEVFHYCHLLLELRREMEVGEVSSGGMMLRQKHAVARFA